MQYVNLIVNQENIVDTSALIAFFVRSETHHQTAQQCFGVT
ncbi:MAG: hypothetical protein ACKPJC_20180 [Microcystis panniformis]|jgi:predicted nucleic acid-binding protein|nr:hypothetical protein BH695_2412 [Microcystis aeruginosa PCC 7806SL]ELS47371.1 hypothetical protein C789_2847 [Microcystis aeruginosa FACHB-905 = DIANCHI905]